MKLHDTDVPIRGSPYVESRVEVETLDELTQTPTLSLNIQTHRL